MEKKFESILLIRLIFNPDGSYNKMMYNSNERERLFNLMKKNETSLNEFLIACKKFLIQVSAFKNSKLQKVITEYHTHLKTKTILEYKFGHIWNDIPDIFETTKNPNNIRDSEIELGFFEKSFSADHEKKGIGYEVYQYSSMDDENLLHNYKYNVVIDIGSSILQVLVTDTRSLFELIKDIAIIRNGCDDKV